MSFGASTSGRTFDNAAGLSGTTISTLSAVGINGAFQSANGSEIGSPGVMPVPDAPVQTLAVAGLASLGLLLRRRAQR